MATKYVYVHMYVLQTIHRYSQQKFIMEVLRIDDVCKPELEITVGHWPLCNQFQHLAKHSLNWYDKFTKHF